MGQYSGPVAQKYRGMKGLFWDQVGEGIFIELIKCFMVDPRLLGSLTTVATSSDRNVRRHVLLL